MKSYDNGIGDYCRRLINHISQKSAIDTLFFSENVFSKSFGNASLHSVSFFLHADNLFDWVMLMNNELKRRGREIFTEKGFDIIHCNDWLTATAGISLCKITGKPLVITLHSTEHERGHGIPHSTIISDVEWWACYEASHIIV